MKREHKRKEVKTSNTTKLVQGRLDDSIESLEKNEAEVARVLNELLKRNPDKAQLNAINADFKEYNNMAKSLTEYMESI